MSKTTVFLTGATGTMGWAGVQEFLKYPEEYTLRVLARPSKKNKKMLAPLAGKMEIVWGDLCNAEDVLRGVTGADYVLHVGGMVSPHADYRPMLTYHTNVRAAENIRDAVLAQGDHQPKVVYIGSIAQMGDRREPFHWTRTGDPIFLSAYDHYGVTKVMAERILTDSGIRCWVSLRQSGILYPAILKNFEPIMFHVPFRGVLEWATVEDSGRLLEHICRKDVPQEFWKRYYNIGSGDEYRISNYRFMRLLLSAVGCPRPEQIFSNKWFATRNFHGAWYADGDVLENYLHFRANIPVEKYFHDMAHAKSVPWYIKFAATTKIAKLFPRCVKLGMGMIALSPEHGTRWWVRHHKDLRINAYYGGWEEYKKIGSFKDTDLSEPSKTPVLLDHGYDEKKPMSEFTLADMQKAAAFRGGKCVSTEMKQGDWDTQLEWESASGNRFKASPRLILLGGHWDPQDMPFPYKGLPGERPWHWDEVARHNPFLNQIWGKTHAPEENNVYTSDIFDGWEKK